MSGRHSKDVNKINDESIKKKNRIKQIFIKFVCVLLIFIILSAGFIGVFFKTGVFQTFKELWVQTAMGTMSHQYLATWFLSDEEIEEIMNKLEVQNDENSNSSDILVASKLNGGLKKNVEFEEISDDNYKGYVIIIHDPSKVKLVDTRKKGVGTILSNIAKEYDAVAAINAGGFADPDGKGNGGILADATIIDKKMLYGNEKTRYRLVGLSKDGTLILGTYNYKEAIEAGIDSAVEFGPFLIVNGKEQIKNKNSGGIQPRTAIGQRKDGTMILVCIDGRKPGHSIGATYMDLQEIMVKYDVYNAANLDGGSSSTMFYNGKIVNKPSTPSKLGERYLPNAIVVER